MGIKQMFGNEEENAKKMYEILKSGLYQRLWVDVCIDPYCISDNYEDNPDYEDIVFIEGYIDDEVDFVSELTEEFDFDPEYIIYDSDDLCYNHEAHIPDGRVELLSEEDRMKCVRFGDMYDSIEDENGIYEDNYYAVLKVQDIAYGEVYSLPITL